MHKKLIALTLVMVMALAMFAGCSSKTETTTAAPTTAATTAAATEATTAATEATTAAAEEIEYQFVSPADAVAAAQDGKTHVLDVRTWENYSAGRIMGSEWCPIFPLEDETLPAAMKEYADKNLNDGEKIYLVCNSGARGAQKATAVLTEAGFDTSLIFTVEGGAKALAEVEGALSTNRFDEAIEWQFVKAADSLAAFEKGEVQLVDVRDDETYAAGHIEGSVQVGLKEVENAEAQTKAFELAKTLDTSKPVHFLCYSGNKCAKTAISVFKDAGFELADLYIIEGGAKDETIISAFVK